MKKSDLEKYLSDYKAEYKKVNGKSLDEALKEKIDNVDYSDFDCENCDMLGKCSHFADCAEEVK
jgi:hypothetical protein